MNPGLYAARDQGYDPTTYHLDGSHQTFYWDVIEPQQDVYNWSSIDTFLAREAAKCTKGALCLITFNGRANQSNVLDPPIRVPQWVFAAGATKVTCPDGFQIPEFWNATYLAHYADFVQDLAARYDGDERVAFVIDAVGKFGETQPCDDGDDDPVSAAMLADGLNPVLGAWADVVNDITAIYADAFEQTQLLWPVRRAL